MSEADAGGVFDDDYLYFHEPFLGERTSEDVQTISALLELEPGTRILDCPCGHGRISNALAGRGFRVSGLDASARFLEHARGDALEKGVDVEYVQGDMRNLPWRGRFDGVVNWFASFGFFSDEQNKAVLKQFHEALRPGGRLVFETQNIARILLQSQHSIERNGDLMRDELTVDLEHARLLTERTVVRDGRTRTTHFVMRWFTVPELCAWLEEVGFENVRTPGLTLESQLVVVADRTQTD